MPKGISNIFGTDGVRGLANSGLITPENSMKLAISAVKHFKKSKEDFKVVIGKDTRLSGYMLEPALTAGFIAAGADVRLLGPIPTPAVSVITRTLRADLGVVISASHNPYKDNGIKFFNNMGFKISPSDEEKITEFFFGKLELVGPDMMGKAKRIDDIGGRYVEFVKASFIRNLTLADLKIVVDCANGAAYKVAPEVFWELGAEVVAIGNEPDGLNINEGCGTTNTGLLQKTVVEHGADIGFAIDGDADRIIVIDEKGNLVDGDYVIAVIATDWKKRGKLKGTKVVATSMSNMALEKYLNSIEIELVRSDVGDKYVIEKMIEIGANLGGEKSGHIIPLDYSTTGDALVAALQVLNYLVSNKKKASDIQGLYRPYPQIFKNFNKEIDIQSDRVKETVVSIENKVLQQRGRLIVRKSGTENTIRIMVESESKEDVERALEEIDKAVSQM